MSSEAKPRTATAADMRRFFPRLQGGERAAVIEYAVFTIDGVRYRYVRLPDAYASGDPYAVPDLPNEVFCEVCGAPISGYRDVCADCVRRDRESHSYGDGTETYDESMRNAGRGHLL